jgi:alkylated DNA repair dioxygenase AlkB
VTMFDQGELFGLAPELPAGFLYKPAIVDRDEERSLVAQVQKLPFKDFEFHGFTGKRRVVYYGYHYDFNQRILEQANEIPSFLRPLRIVAADFAGLNEEDLRQVLVTEYDNAGIGWHKDKSVFGDVIGVSLLSDCQFRFRRQTSAGWERISIAAEPRSIYLLRGPARTEWEHSIPDTGGLRYSVTFRTVVADRFARTGT